MATVTQAIPLLQRPRSWVSPATVSLAGSIVPMRELVLTASATILALGSGDVGVYTITGTLPPGYAYRLAELRVNVNGPSETDLDHLGLAMLVTLTENQVSLKEFMIWNQAPAATISNAIAAIAVRNPSATNDFATMYTTVADPGVYADLVDAGQGQSQIVLNVVDPSPITAALGLIVYIRFLVYSIEQLSTGLIHSTQLTSS